MSSRSVQALALGFFLVATAKGSAASAQVPRLEQAMAADLGAGGPDAIVFRLPEGGGAGVFVPGAQGRYVLKLHPAMGPNVQSLTLGDADHDGLVDLLVTRVNGELVFWKGLGNGDFTSDLVDPTPSSQDAHAPHAAHHAASAEPPVLAGADRDRILAALSLDSLRTDDGSSQLARVTEGVRLPDGFLPRLVVAGRFSNEGRSFAVVGEGSRPRLVLVTPAASTTSSGTTIEWIAREASVPEAVFNVNVGQGGLAFAPVTVSIQVGDTVHWVWSAGGHTVTSGASCIADGQFCSPSNVNCATGPNSASGTTYDHAFPTAGSFPYYCRPHCNFGMTGTVHVQAPAVPPGVVPDRLPSVPLRVDPAAGGMLTLTWGASCSAGATGYGIYEGTLPIPGVYDHKSLTCPAGTATSATITPAVDGSHYYLVVPRSASAEGSYGMSSAGVEIPVGSSVCVATQSLTACP